MLCWFTCTPLWHLISATSLISCQHTKKHQHKLVTKMSENCKNNRGTCSDRVKKFTSITRTSFLLFFFAHSCMHRSPFPRTPRERKTSANIHARLYSHEHLHLNSMSCHLWTLFVGLGVELLSMGLKGPNVHHKVSLRRASILPYPGRILLWKRIFSGNSWQVFLALQYLIRILISLD